MVAGALVGGDVRASAVAHWQGNGVLTVLVLARWCQRGRDPTINMRWKGERGGGGRGITKG